MLVIFYFSIAEKSNVLSEDFSPSILVIPHGKFFLKMESNSTKAIQKKVSSVEWVESNLIWNPLKITLDMYSEWMYN